ncbi:MAG: hypothetical protein WCP24_02795 [bacterium]
MNIEKKIAFYGILAEIIRDETFVDSSADALVGLYEEIKDELSLESFSLNFLKETFVDYKRDLPVFDHLEDIAIAAFRDLSPHMRSPDARRIFRDLSDMSGNSGQEVLFVNTVKVRSLSGDPDGISVVTMVVDDYAGLKSLLEQSSRVEVIHSI